MSPEVMLGREEDAAEKALRSECRRDKGYLTWPTLMNVYCNCKDNLWPSVSTDMKPQKDATSQVSVVPHDNTVMLPFHHCPQSQLKL